jgi:hypothetical protein
MQDLLRRFTIMEHNQRDILFLLRSLRLALHNVRVELSPETRRIHREIIRMEPFNGRCPCCLQTKVVSDQGALVFMVSLLDLVLLTCQTARQRARGGVFMLGARPGLISAALRGAAGLGVGRVTVAPVSSSIRGTQPGDGCGSLTTSTS